MHNSTIIGTFDKYLMSNFKKEERRVYFNAFHLDHTLSIVLRETSVSPTGCQTVSFNECPMETSTTNKTVFPHTDINGSL